MLQRSFNEGQSRVNHKGLHTPRIWKTCTIIPVPKKRSSSQLNDYRPVALTSVAFKCAEKIVLKHLRSVTAGRQDPMQFAYLKDRNTEDTILTLLHKLYQHLDRPKTFAGVIFVDFSTAFNTMQPHLLIEKLLAMEVNPTVISWLYSFLTDRPQQVRIGNALSNVLVINTRAPQGCVLSPVLFTIYMADCRNKEESNLLIKFTDNNSLIGLLKTDNTSYRSAVDELVEWCDQNFLELNVAKTGEIVMDFMRNKSSIVHF